MMANCDRKDDRGKVCNARKDVCPICGGCPVHCLEHNGLPVNPLTGRASGGMLLSLDVSNAPAGLSVYEAMQSAMEKPAKATR